LDEDGTNSWWPQTTPVGRIPNFPDPAVGTIQQDMDAFLGLAAKQYFKTVHDWLKAQVPHHLIAGLDPFDPGLRGSILSNATPYLDWTLADTVPSYSAGFQATNISFYNTYGIPAYFYLIKAAQSDSQYSGVACPINALQCFQTQNAKGVSYGQDVAAIFNNFVGSDGYGFGVGLDYWQFADNVGEKGSYGFVSLNDNLYNGIESCGKSVKDQWGFTTTPELTTGCYGDFITPVKAANRIWLP